MKIWKHCLLALAFVAASTAAAFAQDAAAAETPAKQKPSAVYQVGAAKITVWENKRPDGSTWKNFTWWKKYIAKTANGALPKVLTKANYWS
jgi:hypothetical protein